jgi:hypothetical protein
MIEDFLHLPLVSLTPVANLELGIPPRIFEKIRNDPKRRKSRDTVPLICSAENIIQE